MPVFMCMYICASLHVCAKAHTERDLLHTLLVNEVEDSNDPNLLRPGHDVGKHVCC